MIFMIVAATATSAATIYVPADYTTIQAAITNAAPHDLIEVADGTYVQSTTLTVNKSLTIHGASEAGVIIDASAVAGYGFSIAADDVTLSTFTLLPTTPNYPIHASGTSNPPGGFDNLTLEYITIVGVHQRTGFDIHGYNNVSLSFLTSKDATGGNGVSITGCVNVSANNITTDNNAWGSFAIYCSNSSFLDRACDNVIIYGDTCSFGETNLYLQDEFGLVSTNITVDGYEYIVRNMNYRPEAAGFYHYQDTLADATALALYLDTIAAGSYIINIDDGSYVVADGMAIQPAIDAAVSGDVINLGAGSFGSALSLNLPITLNGANAGIHPAVGTHPTETVGARGAETILTNNYPAIVPAADNITIDGIMFTGDGGRIIDTYSDANFFHLTNCIFDNGATGTTQGVIQFGGGSHTDMTLDFNLFQDKGEHTFYTGGGPFDRLDISWNKFNVEGDGLFWTATPLVDGIIQGNELDGTIGGNPGTGFCTFNAGQAGNVQVLDNWAHDIYFSPFQLGIIGGSIIGNTVERVYPYDGYWGTCFELWGGQYGTAVSSNVTIEDNTFSINDVAGALYPSHGLRLRGPEAPDPGIDGTTIVCRDNMFLDGGVRVDALAIWHQGDPTKYVDAVENWWDDATGPYNATGNPSGLGAPVGDYVSFDPWWADLAMTTIGSNMPVYNVTQGTYHPTVQDGLDNASGGDQLMVDPGSYPDAILFPPSMPITLTGSGMTQTFLTGGIALSDYVDGITLEHFALSGEGAGGRVIHGGQYNNDFTMDHLLIDAEGATYPTRNAIAGGRTIGDVTITYCEFKNVGGWSVFDCATSGWETVMGTVTFAHNYIHECDGAVAFRGDNADRIDLVLAHDNVWENINDNWNPHPTVQNAWACFEAHNVEVLHFYNNTMTNVNENQWGEGQGLQTWHVGDIDVYENVFTDCWQGIWLPGLGTEPAPTGAIHDNSFVDSGEWAVFATHGGGGFTSGILDARGNWWDDVSGPYHPTLNSGGLGGNVSDHVLFEPWSSMADIAINPASSGPINCSQSVLLTFQYTPDAMSPDLKGYSVTFDPDVELSMGTGDIAELEDFDIFYVLDNGDGTFTVDGAMTTSPLIGVATDLFSVEVHGDATGTADVQITDYYLRDGNNADFYGVMNDAIVEVDCTVPPAVTDLVTWTGHEKVDLAWTMNDDSDVDHYEVWRAVWHTGDDVTSAYPEYDDVNGTEPVWPADRGAAAASAEWTLVDDTVPGSATSHTDNYVPRGIYYYEVYAVDLADNYGAGNGPANRATNYWLADVAPTLYDGYVDVADISKLGAAYGSGPSDGTPPYNNEVDVGPTDDHSGTGIPVTDDYVGFEDMMIFAMNFSVVAPMPGGSQGTATAQLAWVPSGARSGALHLVEACSNFKALHMEMALPDGVTLTLIEGELLEGQTSPIFLKNIDANGLDISLGVMGSGAILGGQGELFRVEFSEDVELSDFEITMRKESNEPLEFFFEITEASETPNAYALLRNYPNPFNPKTTIRFDLPEAQDVKLVVYDITGRKIATLVDDAFDAGYHTVDWYGRDEQGVELASGVYFYRIKAGPLEWTERMVLLK